MSNLYGLPFEAMSELKLESNSREVLMERLIPPSTRHLPDLIVGLPMLSHFTVFAALTLLISFGTTACVNGKTSAPLESEIEDATPDFSPSPSIPNVSISGSGSNDLTSGTVTISGTCDSSLSVVSISDASPTSTSCISGTFSTSISVSGPEGSRTVTVSQTNSAGTGSANRTFTLDTSAPTDVTFSSPANNVSTSRSTYSFSWGASSDAISGFKDYLVETFSDSACTNAIASAYQSSTSFSLSSLLTTNSVRVSARDQVLNQSNGTCSPIVTKVAPGTLDTSWSADAKVTTSFSSTANASYRSVTVQSDQKVIAAGTNTDDFIVARYGTDGSLDTSFSSDGQVTIDMDGAADLAFDAAVQADGKIVIAGSAYASGGLNREVGVIRLNSDGSLDTSFSSDGKVMFGSCAGDVSDFGYALTIQPNGKIVIVGNTLCGSAYELMTVYRLNFDGSMDTTFSTDGMLTIDFGSASTAFDVVVDADGKMVIGGRHDSNFAAVRVNSDGTLDTSFSSDGKAAFDFAGGTDYSFSIALQTDGKILLSGVASNNFGTLRLNPDGDLDTSFASSGKSSIDIGSSTTDYIRGILVLPDGKIVLAGYSAGRFAIAKLTSAGVLDTEFDADGKLSISAIQSTALTDTAYSIALTTDGRLIVGGNANNGTYSVPAVIRLFE